MGVARMCQHGHGPYYGNATENDISTWAWPVMRQCDNDNDNMAKTIAMTACAWAWPVVRQIDNDKGNHVDRENNYDEGDENDDDHFPLTKAVLRSPRRVPSHANFIHGPSPLWH